MIGPSPSMPSIPSAMQVWDRMVSVRSSMDSEMLSCWSTIFGHL